ncbi:MAG: Rpn family recombination-promoting nuclease/putative transposase [Candidatus Brocadiae bacterium]|nr:Rpn family recombination-promoting nuclease/putative transposase [Candidatus Brocadiia bacterium]
MHNKYTKRLEDFKKSMDGCIQKVWKELGAEQREKAEEILLEAWEEEEREGFHYTENQILASFLSNQILYPCYDAVFKGVFLNDEDYVLLKDLIFWTIFQGQRKVEKLVVTSTEPASNIMGDKIFYCDIMVILDNKEQCNIEMQLVNQEGLSSRMVIQTCKLHASQAKRGFTPIEVKPTYSLWIMPFSFTQQKSCYSSARLRFDQDEKKVMSDDIQIHFFEFTKDYAIEDGRKSWQEFFGMKTIEDYNTVRGKGAIMERATTNLASLSSNPDFRKNIVEESFKDLGHRIELGAYYKKGREEGREEGEKEGAKKGRIEGEIKAIVSILEMRFGARGLHRMKQIQQIGDLEKLNQIFEYVRTTPDIETFEKRLDECLE